MKDDIPSLSESSPQVFRGVLEYTAHALACNAAAFPQQPFLGGNFAIEDGSLTGLILH